MGCQGMIGAIAKGKLKQKYSLLLLVCSFSLRGVLLCVPKLSVTGGSVQGPDRVLQL
jgi:hypothetical protein